MLDKPSWNLLIKKLLITDVNNALTFLKTAFFPSVIFKQFLYLSNSTWTQKHFK